MFFNIFKWHLNSLSLTLYVSNIRKTITSLIFSQHFFCVWLWRNKSSGNWSLLVVLIQATPQSTHFLKRKRYSILWALLPETSVNREEAEVSEQIYAQRGPRGWRVLCRQNFANNRNQKNYILEKNESCLLLMFP